MYETRPSHPSRSSNRSCGFSVTNAFVGRDTQPAQAVRSGYTALMTSGAQWVRHFCGSLLALLSRYPGFNLYAEILLANSRPFDY
jgi:hypothetical protein